MSAKDMIMLALTILGGLTLFLFGMTLMTEGLRQAVGEHIRKILSGATRSKRRGVVFGTLLGCLTHSGPAIIMLVGFVNAGLMTLAQSVPPMIGANIGTTLSMQVISFRLGDYCYAVMALGFLLHLASNRPSVKYSGRTLLGFGLLFLGMNTASDAIRPYREAIAPVLASLPLATPLGLILGITLSALWTIIVQSSGATIGMCFVLISAGVFTDLRQVLPIVLGAHIGTCSTALLGSIGTNIHARRAAFAHLFFNVTTVALSAAAAPFFYWLLPLTSPNLLRQAANLHTAVMLAGAAVALPFGTRYARLVTWLLPSRQPPPQPSLLDSKLIQYPEKAIYAAIGELQRVTRICARSLRLAMDTVFELKPRNVQVIKLNENVVDDIKLAMKDYLTTLTTRYLSRRQAILIQHLDRCMADIERIGDHIDSICDISLRRHRSRAASFDRSTLESIFHLYEAAETVLSLVIESLNPDNPEFQGMAQTILRARDTYVDQSLSAKAAFTERIANHEFPPIAGIFFSEYVGALDRIVKHSKSIALAEKQPYFWIKRKKLAKLADESPECTPPRDADAHDFLDRLHAEDYL